MGLKTQNKKHTQSSYIRNKPIHHIQRKDMHDHIIPYTTQNQVNIKLLRKIKTKKVCCRVSTKIRVSIWTFLLVVYVSEKQTYLYKYLSKCSLNDLTMKLIRWTGFVNYLIILLINSTNNTIIPQKIYISFSFSKNYHYHNF